MTEGNGTISQNASGVTSNEGNDLKELLLTKFPWKRTGIIFLALAGTGLVGCGVYYLIKRSPNGQIVTKILTASGALTGIKPELLKIPESLKIRLTSGDEVKKATAETFEFLKVMQYNVHFRSISNLGEIDKTLAVVYDRMGDLISFQDSPDFNPKIMRSMERIIFMSCRKTLSHLKICDRLETKQLINGLMVLLDKQDSKK